jgi:hypothetical protein
MYNALPKVARDQADEAYRLWRENPYHPSLHFKSLPGLGPRVWSARAGSIHYRAVGEFVASDVFLWQWIGSRQDFDQLG